MKTKEHTSDLRMISLYLDKGMLEQLDSLADLVDETRTALIRCAVDDFLDKMAHSANDAP